MGRTALILTKRQDGQGGHMHRSRLICLQAQSPPLLTALRMTSAWLGHGPSSVQRPGSHRTGRAI